MSDFTITIVGAGVIGVSLGLALKRIDDPPRLIGHDKELSNAQAGAKKGAFDKVEWNLVNACDKADLIILAIPLNGIRPTLKAIARDLKPNVVITDTTPSKASVLAWAGELLPDHAHYIGGNPLVHPPGSGHEHASADLFQERLYCVTPAPTSNEDAVQLLVGIVSAIGGRPFFLDPTEHDGLVTATEHLPAALSAALLNTLAGQGAWRETRKMAGKLFEQVSAGAVGETDAFKDNLVSNRANLTHWLDSYIAQLQQLRALLVETENSDEALAQWLDRALVERYNWQVDYQQGRFVDPLLTSPKVDRPSFFKQLFGFRR
jgi:prephenate dehydrogenase